MFRLLGGVFLGWALGANDTANIFGPSVASRMIKYRTAVILTSVFVILGALLEGEGGMKTLGSLSNQTMNSAFITSLSAAITVSVMIYFKLPSSTSQSIVGAIIGTGIVRNAVNFRPLTRIILAWVLTPVGAMLISVILYLLLGWLVEKTIKDVVTLDRVLKIGLVLVGVYGAYALGANNIANVTGVFVETGMISFPMGAIVGGLGIASGAITYSKNMIYTVGRGITELSPFSAMIAILGEVMTLYIYARIGIPVSASQAIVGAVAGLGMLKGMAYLNKRLLARIVFAWVGTPSISGIISFILALIFLK